jgi:signal transduction histidine kinase/CheY-like chemotaxis protein/HAMP domain-containing protein
LTTDRREIRVLGRVRTRLLAAFLLLLGATVLLTAMGWVGMRRMQGALAGVEEDLLPRISHALELSERAAQLASTAPKLGDSLSHSELDAHRHSVEALLAQIGQGSQDLREPTPRLQHVIDRLQESVHQHLPALIELSQQKLRLQAQLEGELGRLDRLGQALHAARADARAVDPRVSSLWSTLVLGAAVRDPATIGRLEADAEALLISARRRGALASLPAGQARELVALTEGADSVLACRQGLINLDAQIDYLVTLTRANADDLGEETSRYVAELRLAAAERSERVRAAARTGEVLMLALTGLCVLIGLVATRYVRRLVGEIETITHVMSRLALGDTAQATPAKSRPDELGELARSFEVFRDNLLAKQQLVRDLHAQRELLEAVHDNLTDGLAVFDSDGHLLLWNARLVEMLGRQGVTPRAGSTPGALLEAFPPGTTWSGPDRQRHQGLDQLPPRAWVQADHLELQGADGQVLDLRSCPMPGGGTVTLVTDLSARRAIESQLQQAQKLEVLGQLTGGVAHDFNNYLGTILGNLALLEASVNEDGRARVQWQRVRRAATSAAGLTRRLLAFARRQPLEAEDVPLDEMVEEMRDLIEYSAGDAVTLELDLVPGAPAVHVDRGQLENALLNLVMNSAAAMPQGGTLTVAMQLLPAPADADAAGGADLVELSVTDTGIGMTEEQAAKAFEPFFSTRPPGEGSGLGLSIVYGFVRQSGGAIELHSQPGQGTRVALRFPAVAASPRQAASAHTPMAALEPLPGRVVLLVEDDEAFRATLAEQLRQLEVRVQEATSAEAAIDALAGGLEVHCMVSDVRLGQGASGIELARTVQARWPGLPVLLMSGEMPELTTGPLRHGPARETGLAQPPFLQKPFALAQLLAWLRSLPVSSV